MTIDVSALMNAPVGKLDTVFDTLLGGEYFPAMIDATDPKEWLGSGQRPDGSTWVTLNVPFVILDQKAKDQLPGREKITSRMTIWLDMENGALASGKQKNITLGQLREALGQNDIPNWTIAMLPGAGPLKVITDVTENKKRPGEKFSNVVRVAKAT